MKWTIRIAVVALLLCHYPILAQRNIQNLDVLIHDTAIVREVRSGKYQHPALEIGVKKQFTEIVKRGYPLRICIDPGHIAANEREGYMEERFVKHEKGVFFESDLNMATALLLKDLFVARGFSVMLTRRPGESALGMSFTDWYSKRFKEDLTYDLTNAFITKEFHDAMLAATEKEVFEKYFRDKDFTARGKTINAFSPDITLIIHYNASDHEANLNGISPVVDYNYSVCFVPGSFTGIELSTESQLEDFVRLASTDLISKSILLSSFISNEFESKLGVPSLTPESKPEVWYVKKYSIYTGKEGVYARNLYLTRAINSPLCYGESLIQNNKDELKRLALPDMKVGPYRVSSRVKEVADAYYTGVVKYFKHLKWIE